MKSLSLKNKFKNRSKNIGIENESKVVEALLCNYDMLETTLNLVVANLMRSGTNMRYYNKV